MGDDDEEQERIAARGCWLFIGLSLVSSWLLYRIVMAALYGAPLLGFP